MCLYTSHINIIMNLKLDIKLKIKKEIDNMSNVNEITKMLRNKYAKEWRDKNKEKVKKANAKYWEKKAKQFIEQKEEKIC